MRPIYITGHKNPDSDSIISSIAYAEYKKIKGIQAIASRIGPVSSDTEYLLNRFGFEDPLHIYTAKSTVREIDFDEAIIVNKETTIKEALDRINKTNSKTIYVCDENRNLLGLATISTISNTWLADDKKSRKIMKYASFNNIAKVLKGKIVVTANQFKLSGEIELSPAINSKINKNSIVITSNIKKIEKAIRSKASLVIVLDGIKLTKQIIELANKNNVGIIACPLTALDVSKNIYGAPSLEAIMEKGDKIISIKDSMTTDEASSIVASHRFRAYPIIDGHNKIIGSISRYHLFNYKKKKIILVDHNEKKQSIDDIEYGDVIEIIDHHRFGGFESINPINITTMIVGATSTIIANKFFDERIKLNKNLAGLLLGGIVSDTMNFKSPTTTKIDIDTAKQLEKIAGIKADELQKGIVKASESLLSKRAKEIVYDDFKEFDIGESKVGLSQAICKSFEEYKAIRSALSQYVEDVVLTNNYDLFVIMLTNPNGSGSYLLKAGKKQDIIKEIYPKMTNNNFVNHLISRKKQLLPELIKKLGS